MSFTLTANWGQPFLSGTVTIIPSPTGTIVNAQITAGVLTYLGSAGVPLLASATSYLITFSQISFNGNQATITPIDIPSFADTTTQNLIGMSSDGLAPVTPFPVMPATYDSSITLHADSATAIGVEVLTAPDGPTARAAIGAGTSSLVIGTTTGTAGDGGVLAGKLGPLSTYDTSGVTNGASALQAALIADPVVFLVPGSTLLLNSGVFLDSAAALGTSYTGTYIIDGQGSATIKLGSSLPTTPQYTPDTSRGWAIYVNTERTALSGGVVTVDGATMSTGSASPEMPRLIIRNCIINGQNHDAGLVFGNTAATRFIDCQFSQLMCALSWVGYTDGNGIQGGQQYGNPSGSWLIDQITNGDSVTIDTFKGLWWGVWRAFGCNGGTVRNSNIGYFDLKNCNGIVFDGGHWEPAAYPAAPLTGVPMIKIDNCQVTFRRVYGYAATDITVPLIAVDETGSEGAEYSSHVVIEDPIDIHYYNGPSDPAWSSYLSIANINASSTVEIRRPTGQCVMNGGDLSAGASFHVTSAVTGVQTALADGRFASAGGRLVNSNGTWQVVPTVPGLQLSSALVAPNFEQATVAESGAVGTLAAATYYYVMALLDTQGRYTNQSAVQSYTLGSTGAIRMIVDALTAPAQLVVWRKAATGVQTAPTAYAVLPIDSTQLRLYDTGTHIDGVSWITSSVPVPNTVAASNMTASTSISGMLVPCEVNTQGADTYTIVSGSVILINGLTINGYTPSVNDRVLIVTAPASSGAGTGYTLTTEPANGIYSVTSLAGGNIALARSVDMSAINPTGLLVYVENGSWGGASFWQITTPASSDTAFTWGTTGLQMAPLFGNGSFTTGTLYAYILELGNALYIANGSGSTGLVPTGSAGGQTLTLPATATSDTLVGRASTDTLKFKRITKRVVTTTQSATPAIDTDNGDIFSITALAQAITSMTSSLTGTPVAGDTLAIQFTDNGTARAITFGASFEASTVALPTTTVISTLLTVTFIWNTVTSKWRTQSVA